MNNEPVYITRDGTRIPYLPEKVVTARDAYAATLHVVFRHVADFHLCVVSTMSKKYGIPEDEIMKTIHESEEFKKLTPDAAVTEIYGTETTVTPVSTDSVREKKTPKKLVLKKKVEQPDSVTELAVEPAKELKKKPRQSQSKKPVETPTPTSTLPAPAPAPAVEQEPEPVSVVEQKKEEPVARKGQQKLTFKKMNSTSA